MDAVQRDVARSAVAFVRAFIAGDGPGATAVLLSMPAEQVVELASALAMLTRVALEVGGVPQPEFWAAVNERIELGDS